MKKALIGLVGFAFIACGGTSVEETAERHHMDEMTDAGNDTNVVEPQPEVIVHADAGEQSPTLVEEEPEPVAVAPTTVEDAGAEPVAPEPEEEEEEIPPSMPVVELPAEDAGVEPAVVIVEPEEAPIVHQDAGAEPEMESGDNRLAGDILFFLDPGTPPGRTMCLFQEDVVMLEYNGVVEGTGATHSGIWVTHLGTGAMEDIVSLYVTVSNEIVSNEVVSEVVTELADRTFIPFLAAVELPLGTSTFALHATFSGEATDATHQFEISAWDDLAVNVELRGYIPIRGNTFTLSEPACDIEASGEFSFCTVGEGPGEGCCTTGQFARDYAEPLPGMLIKGSQFMVYYLGSDMKRYVFPRKDTLVSWYETGENLLNGESDICRNVREFSDDVIAGIQIGGNVTVRPGTYLIRGAADPKVYAVHRQGTIRWIANQEEFEGPLSAGPVEENIVSEIYSDAERRIRIIPDGFFVNFTVGTPIESTEDHDPAVEWDWGAPTMIEKELGILPPE